MRVHDHQHPRRAPAWIRLELERVLPRSRPHDTIMGVRVVEAQYDDGILRPTERLGLRPGERVNLIVVRRSDPSRWDFAKLAKTTNRDDIALAEQGLSARLSPPTIFRGCPLH